MGRGTSKAGAATSKSGGGGAAVERGITAEQQIKYKQDIVKLKGKDIDKMSRNKLIGWLQQAALATVGEPFQAKTAEEAMHRSDALIPANSTAQLRKTLKKQASRFRKSLKYGKGVK